MIQHLRAEAETVENVGHDRHAQAAQPGEVVFTDVVG
jgi:hypothetical protein